MAECMRFEISKQFARKEGLDNSLCLSECSLQGSRSNEKICDINSFDIVSRVAMVV